MKAFRLKSIDPGSHPQCKTKEEARRLTDDLQKRMYELLYLMFADNRYSLLILLHGIDASGKDGTVRHIFSGANPQGLQVFSFKKPTPEESRHDFLWRCHRHTPESGLTAIFNRSYYEEITTAMVHPQLLEDQHIPREFIKRSDFFKRRSLRINDFELMLTEQGTVVLKFFLHISKGEQKKRFDARIQDLSKNWKFSEADTEERKFWNQYQTAFEKMLKTTSTEHAPWIVVPADNKWYRDFLVSKTIVERLEKLKMSFPVLKTSAGK